MIPPPTYRGTNEFIAIQIEGSSTYPQFAWGDTEDTSCGICYNTTISYHQVIDFQTGEVRKIPDNLVKSWSNWHANYGYSLAGSTRLDSEGWIHHGDFLMEKILTDEERAVEEKANKLHRLREAIKARCFPAIHIKPSRKPLPSAADIREERARETLRRVIGEDKWKTFLTKGFIQVKGKSGKYYQIFPGHGITKVFENGQLIERLCVVLSGNFPATDSVIMRYLFLLNDEEDFWKRSVKHGVQSSPGREVIRNHIRRFNEVHHPNIFPEMKANLAVKDQNIPLVEVARLLTVA